MFKLSQLSEVWFCDFSWTTGSFISVYIGAIIIEYLVSVFKSKMPIFSFSSVWHQDRKWGKEGHVGKALTAKCDFAQTS
jgi:hypothetical protein